MHVQAGAAAAAAPTRYASYKMHVEVVTAGSLDTTPSFLLELGLSRYLFDAGDGTQRFCLEHGVRLARCQHVFVTRLDPATLGGLAGLLLTLDDIGTHEITLVGPVGLGVWANGLRHFVQRPELRLNVLECDARGGVFDDGTLRATAVPLGAKRAAADAEETPDAASAPPPSKRRRHAARHVDLDVRALPRAASAVAAAGASSSSEPPPSPPAALCFVCETPAIRGRFFPARAAALGVPKGPLYGELANGRAVTLCDGRVIEASQCKDVDTTGRVFIVANCATEALAATLAATPALSAGAFGEELVCVLHATPWVVVTSEPYAAWMRSLGDGVQHIVASRALAEDGACFAASAAVQSKLRALIDAAAPGEFSLFTVTFHANLAHSLTCSP
jgi:ribonuclease Z